MYHPGTVDLIGLHFFISDWFYNLGVLLLLQRFDYAAVDTVYDFHLPPHAGGNQETLAGNVPHRLNRIVVHLAAPNQAVPVLGDHWVLARFVRGVCEFPLADAKQSRDVVAFDGEFFICQK